MTILQTINDYDDIFTFGKYKGKTVDWVAEHNPGYIVWLHENKVAEIDEEILDAAIMDDINNNPPEEWFWEPG